MKKLFKKSLCLILVVVMAMALCACSADPNCGKYTCQNVRVGDISVSASEVYPSGASIELKTAGACTVVLDGAVYEGSWKSDNSQVTIVLEEEASTGTVSGNTLTIDLLGLGMIMTYTK